MEHTQKGLGLLWGPDTAILSCLVSRPGWKVEMNSFRSCPHQTHTYRVSPSIPESWSHIPVMPSPPGWVAHVTLF